MHVTGFSTLASYQAETSRHFTRTKSAPVEGCVKQSGREEKLVLYNQEKYFSGAPLGIYIGVMPETLPSSPTGEHPPTTTNAETDEETDVEMQEAWPVFPREPAGPSL